MFELDARTFADEVEALFDALRGEISDDEPRVGLVEPGPAKT